ncbi:zinc ribbon domain-containing protein [Infirmifilum uzonense]|uniref:zinc ribbon domain-containing protein n=1 Tax=Infirmifilum uzonense TaxID=1550241 RepID=UPI00168CC03C
MHPCCQAPYCSLAGCQRRPSARLCTCKNCGLEVNADINAALNIAEKTGYSPPTPSKIEA